MVHFQLTRGGALWVTGDIALQDDIVEVLAIRFDRVPEGLKEAICEIADEPRLRRLHKAALQAGSIEDFATAL